MLRRIFQVVVADCGCDLFYEQNVYLFGFQPGIRPDINLGARIEPYCDTLITELCIYIWTALHHAETESDLNKIVSCFQTWITF